MPKAATDSGAAAAWTGAAGAAMRQVARKFTAQGFEVRSPEWDDSRCLTITNLPGTTCDVTVHDSGAVSWEYWRARDKGADPGRVAALAMRLLTDDNRTPPPVTAPSGTAGDSLQGIVGRQLRAGGMDVSLDVYTDQVCFEVTAEIVVSNPARPDRGQVRVGGDPGLLWLTGCYGTVRDDTGAITDTIITVLAEDIADGYIQRGPRGPGERAEEQPVTGPAAPGIPRP